MEVNGKNAVVAFGDFKTIVKLDRLERSNAQPKQADVTTKTTYISGQTQESMYEWSWTLNKILMFEASGDEVMQAVTYFIDDAILVGMSRVRIPSWNGHRHFAYAYSSIFGNCPECPDLPMNIYSLAEQALLLLTSIKSMNQS